MTDAEFKAYIIAKRNTWATSSNATTKQGELFLICEQFISDLDGGIAMAGGHPDPPPPRVR